jgi:hypothetical protein
MNSNYKEIFVPDSGMLLDIRVFHTTSDDWQNVLDYASANHPVQFLEDGLLKKTPRFEAAWAKRNESTFSFTVDLGGFVAATHFFNDAEIEFDLRPEDVDSEKKAQAVFGFMREIARITGRTVLLTAENASATEDELTAMSLYTVKP